jgi:hypothetical protein
MHAHEIFFLLQRFIYHFKFSSWLGGKHHLYFPSLSKSIIDLSENRGNSNKEAGKRGKKGTL